jgi:hypothetical protein
VSENSIEPSKLKDVENDPVPPHVWDGGQTEVIGRSDDLDRREDACRSDEAVNPGEAGKAADPDSLPLARNGRDTVRVPDRVN